MAILNLILFKINRLLSIDTSKGLPKFGVDTQSQNRPRVKKLKKKRIASNLPFWILLKINKHPPIGTDNMLMKLESEIPKQCLILLLAGQTA